MLEKHSPGFDLTTFPNIIDHIFLVETMHAQLKMIEHAPSVQMQDAPGSVLYSLKNENGEDKENLEEMGDSNSALNDIRNSEIELEERRAVAENEFYDGDR